MVLTVAVSASSSTVLDGGRGAPTTVVVPALVPCSGPWSIVGGAGGGATVMVVVAAFEPCSAPWSMAGWGGRGAPVMVLAAATLTVLAVIVTVLAVMVTVYGVSSDRVRGSFACGSSSLARGSSPARGSSIGISLLRGSSISSSRVRGVDVALRGSRSGDSRDGVVPEDPAENPVRPGASTMLSPTF